MAARASKRVGENKSGLLYNRDIDRADTSKRSDRGGRAGRSRSIPMPDKFHEECGVVAIYGHPEAAKLAYLGLYALQHRGQESAGICTSDGNLIYTRKEMGHVADIFTKPVLATLPGELAIGHTRYSTAGDTVLLNAQPFSVSCNKGRLAVAHNGNITNTAELRAELGRLGSVFQASSDTELVLHLVAHSSERTLAGALREALLQAGRRVLAGLAGPGPHHRGARPARLPPAGGGRNGSFRRPQVLRVRLRNLRLRPDRRGLPARRGAGRDGGGRPGRHDARTLRAGAAAGAVRLRARLFLAAGFDGVRPRRWRNRARIWAGCWRANARRTPTWWCPCRIPAWRRPSATRPNPGCPSARRSSAIITWAARSSNHRRPSAISESSSSSIRCAICWKASAWCWWTIPSCAAPPAARSCAWCARPARARCTCASPARPRFRRVSMASTRPTRSELIASNQSVEEIRRFVEADSLGYLSLGVAAQGGG